MPQDKPRKIDIPRLKAADDLLTVAEVAEIMGLSKMSVHRWEQLRWTSKVEFPESVKIGKRVYFRKEDLLKYIESALPTAQG